MRDSFGRVIAKHAIEGASNKLTGFSQTSAGASTSVGYSYNANGDLLGDGLRTYTYDAEGRLSTATTGATDTSPTTRYAHNALGQRVFKTEPLYPPSQGDENDPGFWQGLMSFFTGLWAPNTSDAEKLGWAYAYDEEGSLIAETGTGGANSTGSTQHIYLPTAAGPMPIAVIINGQKYAVHAEHLNTPRRLTNESGQAVWQWSYSAFGDEQPTTSANRFAAPGTGTNIGTPVTFNLRYPGQYYDAESGLFYNYFRSYSPANGRYTQPDPIGLDGGWNKFGYANSNPMIFVDPLGLYTEVVVWQGVGIGSSSFGHVSTNINGQNLSWGPGGWDKQSTSATEYNQRQQDFRGGTGVVLNLSPQQEAALASCMRAHSATYNAITNNCGNPVQQCLETVGAGIGDAVLPSAILQNLRSSPSAIGSASYPSPRPRSGFEGGLQWRRDETQTGLGDCGRTHNLRDSVAIGRPAHQCGCHRTCESLRQADGRKGHRSFKARRDRTGGWMRRLEALHRSGR